LFQACDEGGMIPGPVAIPNLTPRPPFTEAAEDTYLRMATALRAATGDPSLLPEPLALRYQHALAQNILKEKVFFTVSSHLRDHGVTPFPIKGMYLLQTLYRDIPGIRPMVDIDLLVTPHDFHTLPSIIRENTRWHPCKKRFLSLRPYLAIDISFLTEETLIEVKRNLILMPLLDLQPFFDAAEPVIIAGKTTYHLRFEHAALLYLLHHIGDHLLHYRRIEPRHLAEFSMILCAMGEIAPFRDLCRSHHLEHWYDLMMFLIYTFFEQPVVTPNDFTIHSAFSVIEKKSGGKLGISSSWRLAVFLYRSWSIPLALRNTLLWLPKKVFL